MTMFGYNIQGFGGGGVASSFAATGGTVTGAGDNVLHSFTSSGNFVATGGDTASVEYLVIAGGAGGGYYGGGCAGGYRTGRLDVEAGTKTVTVGSGGAGNDSASVKGADGGDSVFATITSNGGGGGGTITPASSRPGNDGGSGGGGGSDGPSPGGSGNTPSTSPSQGNDGGNGAAAHPNYAGGGGGGSGGAGGNGSGSTGGAGGESKHVLAASSPEALDEWMGTLQANVELCALPPEEQEELIAQDELAADAEELQERLTGIAHHCAGLCNTVCTLASACCESFRSVHGSQSNSATGSRRKYHAVTPTRASKGAGSRANDETEVEGSGTASAPLGVYICRKKQSIRETADISSRIVGWVQEGMRVEVFEEQPSVATGHKRLRLAEGWVNSGSGAIVDGRAVFVYFEKEPGSGFGLSWP